MPIHSAYSINILTEALLISVQGSEFEFSGEDEESGGALLNLSDPTSDEGLETLVSDHQLPAFHETELYPGGSNRFATLINFNEGDSDEPEEPQPKARIPSWNSSFWNIYVNKLRVYAADTGVCDLEAYE